MESAEESIEIRRRGRCRRRREEEYVEAWEEGVQQRRRGGRGAEVDGEDAGEVEE